MKCARAPAGDLDQESAGWLSRLSAEGRDRPTAERDLHARLVRIALAEVPDGIRLGAAMSGMGRLERFLRTDPRDVGCDEAMAVLHIYVDLVATGEDAAGRYPGVAAHLAACGPCGEDFTGLLLAVADGQ